MTSIRLKWFISMAVIIVITGFFFYYNLRVKKFSLEEIAQKIDTEIYYRHPPVHMSFGDGYFISDKYKNVKVNMDRYKIMTHEEIKFDKSREMLGLPYRYRSVRGVQFDVNYPSLVDSGYWLSRDPNLSTFANDFEIELKKLLPQRDSVYALRKALNFYTIALDPIEDCQPDLFFEPLNITERNEEDSYYLFQAPGTEFFYIIRFQMDQNNLYKDVQVYPWSKEKAKNAFN